TKSTSVRRLFLDPGRGQAGVCQPVRRQGSAQVIDAIERRALYPIGYIAVATGGSRMQDRQVSALLARLQRVVVPPALMRDALQAYSQAAGCSAPKQLAACISDEVVAKRIAGDRAEVVLAAKLKILSLACLVRDHALDEWTQGDPSGIVLFHDSLFE